MQLVTTFDSMAPPRSQDGLVLLWSGGKDAMLAHDVIHSQSPRRIEALLTTVTEEEDRVTMHGTPRVLIEQQADALGLPLHVMRVPPQPPNEVYEARLEAVLGPLLETGNSTVVAGDLFLDDVRAYREQLLRSLGARPLFPLWRRDTEWLAQRFLERGYRATVTAVDTTQLDASFLGRPYDEAFLEDLPDAVDPCGERGAFHTFVSDGPPFARPVPVEGKARETEGRIRTIRLVSAKNES
ncbi:MAG: hypothetical protein V5A58_07230 [Salinibacter sp.]|uniref:Dph6-related ATP pyrophosphatase n=1 Tax=Salinibacter sp. TaxID=2065818 RepID=UPI002FC306F7